MNYINRLKEHDLKVTPQRVAIVQELDMCGHLNVDQLYNKLLHRFPSMSLATIYKNMNAMIDRIFVQEVKIPNSKSVYELCKDNHAHFVCNECGKIEDVYFNTKDILADIKANIKHTITSSTVVLNGSCKECLE